MAYDPDVRNQQDILEAKNVFWSPDRQAAYDAIYNHLIKKFGVTVVGDRLTIRTSEWQAQFVLLEVELPRDEYIPENK